MRDRIDDFHRDKFVRQHSERPPLAAVGCDPAGQSRQARFSLPVEERLALRRDIRLAQDRHLKAALAEATAHVLHALAGAIKRLGDARIDPGRTAHVRLEQNTRATGDLRSGVSLADQAAKIQALLFSQFNDEFLFHGDSPYGNVWPNGDIGICGQIPTI